MYNIDTILYFGRVISGDDVKTLNVMKLKFQCLKLLHTVSQTLFLHGIGAGGAKL